MFLKPFEVTPKSLVSEIVALDYRTSDIFQKHGIEYCCGGKWPLEVACMLKGIEIGPLITEIENATRNLQLPSNLPFDKWKVDFLVDYIVNIHHHYLKETLPGLETALEDFSAEHAAKYPYFKIVMVHFGQLKNDILPHIKQEEETIFPYLRQVAHAYENRDSFASLLVKTLRKPVSKVMEHEHRILNESIYKFRQLTSHYTPPEKACTNHSVILSKLKELDNDLVQHVYLENEILFPKLLAMEKELLV